MEPPASRRGNADALRAVSQSPSRSKPGTRGSWRFDVYRTILTETCATLFDGGDWHWRLIDQTGAVVADCGGYRNQRDCLAAVEVLRAQAGSASVVKRQDANRAIPCGTRKQP